MVDIHTHILPGVDDGADDFTEACEMLRIASQNGTTDVLLTPHYLTDNMRSMGFNSAQLKSQFEVFKAEAAKIVPGVNVYMGAELFGVSNIEDVIENDVVIPINNTKNVLVEFGFEDNAKRALEVTKALTEAGYRVVIAHPERYLFVQKNPRAIVPFLESDALIQVNAQSILGGRGPVAQDVALAFIESGLAAAIASDAHSAMYRAPDLSEAYTFVSSTFSTECADVLFDRNPRAILFGKRL